MSTTTLNTTEEFYAWAQGELANKYRAEQVYGLDRTNKTIYAYNEDGSIKQEAYTNWRGEQDERPVRLGEKTQYYLVQRGQGYRGEMVHLPDEVGEALAADWKLGSYRNFIGQRKVSGLIKLLKGNKAAAEMAKQGERIMAETKAQGEKNVRNNRRKQAADDATKLIAYLNQHLETLGLALFEDASQMTLAQVASLINQQEA